MKRCPYCAEKIQDEAIVCRYCGMDLPESGTPARVETKKAVRQKLLLPAGIILGVMLLLVGGYFLFNKKAAPGKIPTQGFPSGTPTSEPQAQGLYSENFDDPSKLTGWDVKSSDANAQAQAKDGAYHLSVENGSVASIQREQGFTDATLAVDLEFLGPDPATASLICRNGEGSYTFSISNTGHWKIQGSGKNDLSGETKALRTGVNKVTVACIADQLSFSLNGVELGSAQDNSFSQGQIGLALASTGKAQVTFDNLTISGPSDQVGSAPGKVALVPSTPTPAAPTPTATLIPTAVSTLRPTLIPADELTLYQTDFENNDASLAKWRTFAYSFASHSLETEGYTLSTNTSFYRFNATETNQRIFSIYDTDLGTSDVDITLKGMRVWETGYIGLVCRYTEKGWYQFMLEPGQWTLRLAKYDDGGQLHFYKLLWGSYVGTDPVGIANLRFECKGNRLTAYTDGQQQASVHDGTFPDGKVGVLAWSYDKAGQVGFINNFSVERASWSESAVPGPAPTPAPDGTIYTTKFENLDALSQHWFKQSQTTVLGPGASLQTTTYINDFDPGTGNVKISGDFMNNTLWRSLICRYSEDGGYSAGFADTPAGKFIRVSRTERGLDGLIQETNGAGRLITEPVKTLGLTCAGSQIIAYVNGEPFVYMDDTRWSSGRYGFSFSGPASTSIKAAFGSFSVEPASKSVFQPGEAVLSFVSDTPHALAANWGLDPIYNHNIKVQGNSLMLNSTNGIRSDGTIPSENSEVTVDMKFLSEGGLGIGCRNNNFSLSYFNIRSNGDWEIRGPGKALTNGNSTSIHPDQNQFTIRCLGSQLTLIANGETVATLELPSYMYSSGKPIISFDGGTKIQLNSISLKVLQSSASALPASTFLNQVSIPVYQPGEAIYEWNNDDVHQFTQGNGNRDGTWGRWMGAPSAGPDDRIVVPAQNNLTVWILHPGQYEDLPLEISTDTTFTGKSGAIGFMCRLTSLGRYEFLIQPDGSWVIRRNTSDWYEPRVANMVVLAHGTSTAIQADSNHITATCQGNELIFSANGTELGRVQDDLYPEGQVGIFLEAYTAGSFTNLSVQRTK